MAGFPGFTLTGKGQALLAKLQAGGTLEFTKVATGSGKPPADSNIFSAAALGNVVTVTNAESGPAVDAADTNSGFGVAVETQGAGGVAEVTRITCLAASELAGGEYVTIHSPFLAFYIWFSLDGFGADPAPAGLIGIEVALAGADTAIGVAVKTATAIDHHRLDLADLRTLIIPRQDLIVQDVSRVDEATSRIAATLTNAGLVTGYWLTELGIFATDPDDGEVLYAVTNAGDNGDYIPTEGAATLIDTDLLLLTAISSAENLILRYVPGTYATTEAFDDHKIDPAAHGPVIAAGVGGHDTNRDAHANARLLTFRNMQITG